MMNRPPHTYHYYYPQRRRRRRRRRRSTSALLFMLVMMATTIMMLILINSNPLAVMAVAVAITDDADADADDGVTSTSTNTNTVGTVDYNESNNNDNVCDNTDTDTAAASSNTCDGSVNNSKMNKEDEEEDKDDDDDDLYESPDIEWCRRRPTWRNDDDDDDDDHDHENKNNENYNVREYCSKILNYHPNLELLIKGCHPYLSSSYTNKYKFHDDNIFDEIEDQQQQQKEDDNNSSSSPTYNDISNILHRPLIKQLFTCMDNDNELQNELLKFKSNNNNKSSRMIRPNITKIHRRRNNDIGDNNNNNNDNEDNGLPVIIIVENALNEIEAQYVISLSKCLRSHPPIKKYIFEARRFEETTTTTTTTDNDQNISSASASSATESGNDVTFLAGFLQILLPGIANQIHQIAFLVWNETKWGDDDMEFTPINNELLSSIESLEESVESSVESESVEQSSKSQSDNDNNDNNDSNSKDETENKNKVYTKKWWPDPRQMGIRTTEYLSYDKWGGLGYHEDADSDYTVLVALSNPNDYKGGEFTLFTEYDDDIDNQDNQIENNDYDNQIKDNDNNNNAPNNNSKNKISFKPNRLSAVVFLSEFQHGVESITTPGRVTFANELWRYDDSPTFIHRPSPIELIFGNPNRIFSFDDDYKYPYKEGDEEDEYGHYRDDNEIDDNDDGDDDDAYDVDDE